MSIEQCRHAPPSKRVEIKPQHHSPVSMVQALVKAWDPEVADILAEWLEAQGFPGWAQKLRRKSFETWDMIRIVDDLAGGMGVTTPKLTSLNRQNWKRKWKRSHKKRATPLGCEGT